jgi:transcriptional regulatory protein LevR/transcriptional regulator with AAA-type ATPase domain
VFELTNQEKIYNKLIELSYENGITAQEIADMLGLSRANVSHELNKLCKAGKIQKTSSRPVRFLLPDISSSTSVNAFDEFVKSNISLKNEIEQAKAAILYPPNGLPSLIFGETGVGKSMFASMMHSYSVDIGAKSQKSEFIVFNCADYATNPSLLLSQLFGTKKGSYTGSIEDKAGLVELADNGVLFLDEVHRLPPEGQEMLFTLMDTGEYRRLGETDKKRKSTVLIICATTEDPESSLLNTFIRRIPITIKLPSLRERTLDERLFLIKSFFKNESIKLNKEIYVSCNTIRAFLSYDCPNNIGQLKSDVQLICAKSYSEFLTNIKNDIRINSKSLPQYIRDGLLKEKEHRKIWTRLTGDEVEYFRFHPNMESFFTSYEDNDNSIYSLIDEKLIQLKKRNLLDEEIESILEKDIFSHFKKYIGGITDVLKNKDVSNLLDKNILKCVDQVASFMTSQLNRPLDNNIYTALALHINTLTERIMSSKTIINPQLQKIKNLYPNEFQIALKSKNMISEYLGYYIPEDEAGYLTIFLLPENELPTMIQENVKIIVIAHGESTASSIANVANRLLNKSNVLAIDASLDFSPSFVLDNLKELIQKNLDATGFLLLVDMGSLTTFAEIIETAFKIPSKAVPMVSTLHAIEASRKAILGFPLAEIYKDVNLVSSYSDSLKISNTDVKNNNKVAIITACLTGEGGSVALKSVLNNSLNYDNDLFEVIPLNCLDKNYFRSKIQSIQNEREILFIVSSFPVSVDIQQYNMYDVISMKVVGELQELIDIKTTLLKLPALLKENIDNFDGSLLFDDISLFVKNIESVMKLTLKDAKKVTLILHTAFMLSRLAKGDSAIPYPDKDVMLNENIELYNIIKSEYSLLKQRYNVELNDDEACYLISYLTSPM